MVPVWVIWQALPCCLMEKHYISAMIGRKWHRVVFFHFIWAWSPLCNIQEIPGACEQLTWICSTASYWQYSFYALKNTAIQQSLCIQRERDTRTHTRTPIPPSIAHSVTHSLTY